MVYLYAADIRNLPDPQKTPEVLNHIYGERKKQILKYRKEDDRKRCLGAGLLLEKILPYYGASPENITAGANGKPGTEGISFNISHSGHFVICAVGKKAVGCDIERIDEEPEGVAERFFHQNEIHYLATLEMEKRNEMFFRLWTLKESYIKMTGDGLHLPINSFEILLDGEKIQIRRGGKILPCHIREYTIPGYKISVCAEEREFDKNIVFAFSNSFEF